MAVADGVGGAVGWALAERGGGAAAGRAGLRATFVAVFLLSALGIAAVAVFTGWRIAKSMRGLAAAARRLSLGEAVDDLPGAGPAETRETVRAFNRMRERLDHYVRDRTAMLAAVSHNLRTPITSPRLHAEFVEDEGTPGKIVAGLAIARSMIRGHGGDVRLENRAEGGLRAMAVLPGARRSCAAAGSTGGGRRDRSNGHLRRSRGVVETSGKRVPPGKPCGTGCAGSDRAGDRTPA